MPLATAEVASSVDAPRSAPARVAPFSAGAVIGAAFQLSLRNLVPFAAAMLVLHLPVFALDVWTPAGASGGWASLHNVADLLCGLPAAGALTHGTLEALRGRRPGAGELLAVAFRTLPRIVGTSLRVGLWVFFGWLLLVIPALFFYTRLYLAVPAALAEPEGDALDRSRTLTQGHRWSVFAVMVVTWTIVLGFSTALVALLRAVGVAPGLVAGLAVRVPMLLVMIPAYCARAVAYEMLRAAKEGAAAGELVKVFE